ncbi:hypothetical protein KQX54_010369 [Cotesia glomerata]|uniref:Uncharacterized protein n=1 Tax=Cotesia glomerata TaxID=32391 RepID=A0AAV7J221_COTGL|nr:hypothetical protein KQX54_010369 [Cotesia glomerata]
MFRYNNIKFPHFNITIIYSKTNNLQKNICPETNPGMNGWLDLFGNYLQIYPKDYFVKDVISNDGEMKLEWKGLQALTVPVAYQTTSQCPLMLISTSMYNPHCNMYRH